jgi:hypothetical protein
MNLNVGAVYEVPLRSEHEARIESALFVRCRVDTIGENTGTRSSSGLTGRSMALEAASLVLAQKEYFQARAILIS